MQLTSMDKSSLIHFKVITFDLFCCFNLLLVCVINPFCYVVKVSSTLWTQAILIGEVTLHLTKEQNTIFQNSGKVQCPEVKNNSSIIPTLHLEMSSRGLLES
jgi:hypothetical protein